MLVSSLITNAFRLMEPYCPYIDCHKLYVLLKNLCISKIEEKFKFPLILHNVVPVRVGWITALSCRRVEVFETEI